MQTKEIYIVNTINLWSNIIHQTLTTKKTMKMFNRCFTTAIVKNKNT